MEILEWLKVDSKDGSGYGSGYGDGSGDSIKEFNKQIVYLIDGVQTIIDRLKDNVAKGKILNQDLTLTPCFVVKGQNMFAHGKTLKEAIRDLQEKIFDELDVDEKIAEFKQIFNYTDKYLCSEFYKWHNLLTGSCEMGRDSFVKNHNINLKDKITVNEFIELCKNDYGSEIILQLKQ